MTKGDKRQLRTAISLLLSEDPDGRESGMRILHELAGLDTGHLSIDAEPVDVWELMGDEGALK